MQPSIQVIGDLGEGDLQQAVFYLQVISLQFK